jgi:hypothetical protein
MRTETRRRPSPEALATATRLGLTYAEYLRRYHAGTVPNGPPDERGTWREKRAAWPGAAELSRYRAVREAGRMARYQRDGAVTGGEPGIEECERAAYLSAQLDVPYEHVLAAIADQVRRGG